MKILQRKFKTKTKLPLRKSNESGAHDSETQELSAVIPVKYSTSVENTANFQDGGMCQFSHQRATRTELKLCKATLTDF